jgi:hypothetical protein
MGQVTYTEERIGDVSDGDNIEAILDALAAQSVTIDTENIRAEGVDRTTIESPCHVTREGHKTSQTRTQIVNAVPAVLNMGGSDIETGTITLLANEVLEVHAWLEVSSDPAAAGPAAGYGIQDTASAGVTCILEIRLYASFNAGPFAQVAPTRQIGDAPTVGGDGWIMSTVDITGAGTWKFQIWANVTIAGASANVDNVTLAVKQFRRTS